jgi:hypothetical protein
MFPSFSDTNHHKAIFVTSLELLCDDIGLDLNSTHFASRVLLDFDLLRVWRVCGDALSINLHEFEVNDWAG